MEGRPRRALLWAYAVWTLGMFAFFVPAATWSPASRFALTRALVEESRLTIDTYARSTGDRARREPHWYTDKAPVPSVLAAPPYALLAAWNSLKGTAPHFTAIETRDMPAKKVIVNRAFQRSLYVCSLATAGLSGAVLALAMLDIVRRRTSAVAAQIATSLIVLGTPIFPYATSFYGHVVAAACLVLGVALIDRRRDTPPDRLRLAGACLATAPGCEYLVTLPVICVLVWLLLGVPRERRVRALISLAEGALVPVLLVAAYHTACFGVPWKTGYSFITRPEFAAGHALGFLGVRTPSWEGTWGLLFGIRRGLFYMAPIALFGVAGLVIAAFRERDGAARVGLACLASLFWLNASYYMWWGGAAAGPRHLVPALAFLALGVARVLRIGWVRPLVALAGIVSVANFLAITAVGLEAPEYDDILRRYTWPAFLNGKLARLSGASSVGLRLGLHGLWSLLPLALWVVFGQVYLLRLARAADEEGDGPPSSATGAWPFSWPFAG